MKTLQRLAGAGPPLTTDAWSLADAALALVLEELDRGRRSMVECGSGRSTVVLARRLRELGAGHLHSLEHDPAWAELARTRLGQERLEAWATVVEAPLEPDPLAGPTGRWYAAESVATLPVGIDLLLVDGPPAGDPNRHLDRVPALARLGPRLEPGATVILDDARRAGEAAAITAWTAEHRIEFEHDEKSGTATGIWRVYVARQA